MEWRRSCLRYAGWTARAASSASNAWSGGWEGVRRVTADHQRGQVQVVLDPATVAPAAVQAAIEQADYTVAGDGDGEVAP